MSISVYFGNTNSANHYYSQVPEDLLFDLQYARSDAYGGPKMAEIRVTGPVESLWNLFEWMRRPVEVYSSTVGEPVWWGFINEVRLNIYGAQFGASLDSLTNRVKVLYSRESADGATEAAETPWAEDLLSQSLYGIKETITSIGTAYDPEALAQRDEILDASIEPTPTPNRFDVFDNESDPYATLVCLGPIELAKWQYYEYLEGRLEHDPAEDGIENPVGWRLLGSTSIRLTSGSVAGIHDFDDRLTGLGSGVTVWVAKTGVWSGIVTINTEATEPVTDFSGTDYSFAADDDIYGPPGSFVGKITPGSVINITGSPNNSQNHLIKTVESGYMTTYELTTGAIIGEAPGPNITFEVAQRVNCPPRSLLNSFSTNSTDIRVIGDQLAQSFTPILTGPIGKIAVKVKKVGSPVSGLRVAIFSNSGGKPGTLLTSVTLNPAYLPANNSSWTWFNLASPYTVTASTTYWLVITSMDTYGTSSYYTVQSAAIEKDSTLGWSDYSNDWVPLPSGHSIPYRIWYVEDNLQQIERILSASSYFNQGLVPTTNTVMTNPYTEEERTLFEVIQKLLDGARSSSNQRFWMTILQNGDFIIYEEPTHVAKLLDLRGHVYYVDGTPAPLWTLPVGERVRILDVPAQYLSASNVMIESAESRDGLSIQLIPKQPYNDQRGS